MNPRIYTFPFKNIKKYKTLQRGSTIEQNRLDVFRGVNL